MLIAPSYRGCSRPQVAVPFAGVGEVEMTEVNRLSRTLRSWEEETLNYHRIGAASRPTEAVNLVYWTVPQAGLITAFGGEWRGRGDRGRRSGAIRRAALAACRDSRLTCGGLADLSEAFAWVSVSVAVVAAGRTGGPPRL